MFSKHIGRRNCQNSNRLKRRRQEPHEDLVGDGNDQVIQPSPDLIGIPRVPAVAGAIVRGRVALLAIALG